MIITLRDYCNNRSDHNIGNLEDIKRIYLSVLSGDEVLEVVYKNGDIKKFDSSQKRIINYNDGDYRLYDYSKNFNVLSHPQWIMRKDSYEGIKIVTEYMNDLESKEHEDWLFSIGDKVKIVDGGLNYSTYVAWFEKNEIARELCTRYAYDECFPTEGIVGEIIAIAPHENDDVILCLIQTDGRFGKCYLINQRGLKKIDKD